MRETSIPLLSIGFVAAGAAVFHRFDRDVRLFCKSLEQGQHIAQVAVSPNLSFDGCQLAFDRIVFSPETNHGSQLRFGSEGSVVGPMPGGQEGAHRREIEDEGAGGNSHQGEQKALARGEVCPGRLDPFQLIIHGLRPSCRERCSG